MIENRCETTISISKTPENFISFSVFILFPHFLYIPCACYVFQQRKNYKDFYMLIFDSILYLAERKEEILNETFPKKNIR